VGLQELERGDLVQPAPPGTTLDGVPVARIARPASVEEASQVLAAAAADGLAVAFAGGASKLGLGNPPERVDLLVSTERLDQVLEHAAGDLVVRVQAGVRLADLQAALAPAGQWLALDPPEPRATVGGVVAADASGPRRLRYGTVRDLIIGITVVLADGTVARAGGKVVKNVAGYDLAKLFCGSLGTLGMIAEATFRLHPLPAAAAVVTLQVETPEQVGQAVRRLARSPLEPSAVELVVDEWGWPGRLTTVFEGIRPGVEAQAAAAAELLGQVGEAAVAGPGQTDAALGQLGARPFEKAELALKAACPPADLSGVLAELVIGRGRWDGSVCPRRDRRPLDGQRPPRGRPAARQPRGPVGGRDHHRDAEAAGRPRGQPGRGQGATRAEAGGRRLGAGRRRAGADAPGQGAVRPRPPPRPRPVRGRHLR